MRIIFSGSIGRLPVGGHAWVDMQYLAGLRDLGHDVYYLEDCGAESWVYNWDTQQVTQSLDYPSAYVRDCVEPIGLGDKWSYRAGDQSEGLTPAEMQEVCSGADLFLIRAVPLTVWRPEYDLPRRRAFIDMDPGFTQISLLDGHKDLSNTVSRCEQLFTIAQRLGAEDCAIPDAGRAWTKTVAPISLVHWPFAGRESPTHFTTVMQWRGFREVVHDGVQYGQKDKEFPKYLDLPRQTDQRFLLALTGKSPADLMQHGWEVVEGWIPSRTAWTYRDFIADSRGEFSVAKHGYIAMRGGWFSDRSVCYLASGRPVLVADTGLGDWIATGEGLLTFSNAAEAIAGIEIINGNYERHRRAARRLAEEHFDARRVLPPLLEAALT